MGKGAIPRISVLGAGSWGTTVAHHLAQQGNDVSLWVYEPDVREAIERRRENPVFLPGVRLSRRITPTNDLRASVAYAAAIVSAAPSHVVGKLWEALAPAVPATSSMNQPEVLPPPAAAPRSWNQASPAIAANPIAAPTHTRGDGFFTIFHTYILHYLVD